MIACGMHFVSGMHAAQNPAYRLVRHKLFESKAVTV